MEAKVMPGDGCQIVSITYEVPAHPVLYISERRAAPEPAGAVARWPRFAVDRVHLHHGAADAAILLERHGFGPCHARPSTINLAKRTGTPRPSSMVRAGTPEGRTASWMSAVFPAPPVPNRKPRGKT